VKTVVRTARSAFPVAEKAGDEAAVARNSNSRTDRLDVKEPAGQLKTTDFLSKQY
jgi:hypothetical protein